MKIKPLTGQALIEIIPEPEIQGGVAIPQRSLSPEEVQERSRDPEKPGALKGVVREIGPWPKLKCGLAVLPEFHKGSIVFLNSFRGETLRDLGGKMKLVRNEDVLAVISK